MSDEEHLISLREELAEEKSFIEFYESNAFKNFLKKIGAEIEIARSNLYNGGKASARPAELNKVNAARVEISVRENLIRLFTESFSRFSKIEKEIRELEKHR